MTVTAGDRHAKCDGFFAHNMLKLARTIAGLAGSDNIETAHLAEVIQYRPRVQA